MSIYTRTGDNGTTSLFGGKRVLKSDLLVETYGIIDELSSFLGLLIFYIKNKSDKKDVTAIQKDLYLIMGNLAGARTNLNPLDKRIAQFEKEIDLLENQLPPLSQFVLPQGSIVSIYAHICRTICRRAERNFVRYYNSQKSKQKNFKSILSYFNRLSDYLYIKARQYNKNKKEEMRV
ncbi:ATP:cob(I)alamin adenosyltransferase [Candidatus Roizmanbacteria bacterium CG_4_10_14_0_8_um_filter_33_9]|uniref:Corrinoid adenosyltransferase n=1 Tax=Candidatus Roizmanbacteria bacterium CG_4_10_14_0_8_um_filter_33_9 TaxID=1974826 RepID=A0A2M7QJP1_9BACT|nr:MAG: ATP:cob(I)alamin adenosyltransferase [Candidatus Roizmanbacteria bacterium CG_4_10_14_0_8_um_filter_33_9]